MVRSRRRPARASSRSGCTTRSPSSTEPQYAAATTTTGVPWISGGNGGCGGTLQQIASELSSSGAAVMKSRQAGRIVFASSKG